MKSRMFSAQLTILISPLNRIFLTTIILTAPQNALAPGYLLETTVNIAK